MKKYNTLRIILGDQLNINHSWFNKVDDDTLYLISEVKDETNYTRHHIQKVVAFFLAMRNFSDELKEKGHQVLYLKLDDSNNKHSINGNALYVANQINASNIEYQEPDEFRLDKQLCELENEFKGKVAVYNTEHFLTDRDYIVKAFGKKKSYLMESFYRKVRKEYNILMDGDQPLTGRWNFDSENRKSIPKGHIPPAPLLKQRSVSEIVNLLKELNIETIGRIDEDNFNWYITRDEALELLEYFIYKLLDNFGNYQDAMHNDYWALYHSRLSFAMNIKLITPLEVVIEAVGFWQRNPSRVDLAQLEGFVRQIIGWREYMRQIYWAFMPEYKSLNYFNNSNKLPSYFWSGNTKMNCMSKAINQSLDYAYAHHIQRLMITGNFALLTGINPNEVDDWYLGIYIDAIEWVEITNTRGMSQFADGGIVGTKPYVSSANYINKMSNYCTTCHYDKSKRVGENACPFNSLYWNFFLTHSEKLSKNPRIGMAYTNIAKMSNDELTAIKAQANYYLENIEEL